MKRWPKKIRGRTGPRRGKMNGLESRYAGYLALRQAAGELLWFRFEGISLRIGRGAIFTPDFAVQLADGTLELHEVKGRFFREAAMVRIKVAAELFPFRFIVVRYVKGRFTVQEFSDAQSEAAE